MPSHTSSLEDLTPATTPDRGSWCCRRGAVGESMTPSGLLDLVAGEPRLAELLADARGGGAADTSLIAPPALRPFVAAALAREGAKDGVRTVLAITATGR